MDTTDALSELSEDKLCTIEEALRRCAGIDLGLSRGYLSDAERCEQSDHPVIKARSADFRNRAEDLRLSAEKYMDVLSLIE